MSDCGVYKITNIINNKYYIGSAKDLKSRKRVQKDLELNHKLIPHKSKMRLKEQDIEIIVNRLKKGHTQKSIANDMNIDQSTVSLIKKRRNCV